MVDVIFAVILASNPYVDSSRAIVRFYDIAKTDSAYMVNAVSGVCDDLKIEKVRTSPFHYIVIKLNSADYRDVYKRLKAVDGVKYIAPTAYYRATHTPNDPFWNFQWGPPFIHAPSAWDVVTGDEDVIVAVVDQGVQYTHPDLSAHFGSVKGYDFVDNDSDPLPADVTEDHGTHVAGIIAAEMDNNIGIAGMAQVTLYSMRVLDPDGVGSVDDISDGITWAVNHGARVVNMSLGGPSGHILLQEACQYALNHGAILFAASGNDGADSVDFPARYPEVVAVSAIGMDSAVASYSNHGPEVELAAPGTNIYSTIPYGDYAYMSGTSMATPFASGVAALVLSRNPALNPQAVRNILDSTAMDFGAGGRDPYYGYGVIDALSAVQEASNYPVIDTLINDNGSPYYYCANEWGPYIKATRYSVSEQSQLRAILALFGTPLGFDPANQTGHYFVWTDNSGVPGSLIAYGDFLIPTIPATSDQWLEIDLSSDDITVNGTFWVGVSQATSSAPYLRQDSIPNPSSNAYSTNGGSSWGYDTDGNYFIRAVISRRTGIEEGNINPADEMISLQSNVLRGTDALQLEVKSDMVQEIQLVDITGRVVRSRDVHAAGGITIPLSGLRSGVYFVVANSVRGVTEIKKVIVER